MPHRQTSDRTQTSTRTAYLYGTGTEVKTDGLADSDEGLDEQTSSRRISTRPTRLHNSDDKDEPACDEPRNQSRRMPAVPESGRHTDWFLPSSGHDIILVDSDRPNTDAQEHDLAKTRYLGLRERGVSIAGYVVSASPTNTYELASCLQKLARVVTYAVETPEIVMEPEIGIIRPVTYGHAHGRIRAGGVSNLERPGSLPRTISKRYALTT